MWLPDDIVDPILRRYRRREISRAAALAALMDKGMVLGVARALLA